MPRFGDGGVGLSVGASAGADESDGVGGGESGEGSVALESEDVSYTDHELQLALLT